MFNKNIEFSQRFIRFFGIKKNYEPLESEPLKFETLNLRQRILNFNKSRRLSFNELIDIMDNYYKESYEYNDPQKLFDDLKIFIESYKQIPKYTKDRFYKRYVIVRYMLRLLSENESYILKNNISPDIIKIIEMQKNFTYFNKLLKDFSKIIEILQIE